MKQLKEKRSFKNDLIFFISVSTVTLILLLTFPERRHTLLVISWKFLLEMVVVLPAVTVLIGLFKVFIPQEMVVKYIGRSAGFKSILLSIVMGALPTGPLYVAFPLASTLLKKGARISSIVVFLSAWACIKVPQEMVEIQFLGVKFMALRLTLTIIFVVVMGFVIEWILEFRRGSILDKG